jgi:hypothetical protein
MEVFDLRRFGIGAAHERRALVARNQDRAAGVGLRVPRRERASGRCRDGKGRLTA